MFLENIMAHTFHKFRHRNADFVEAIQAKRMMCLTYLCQLSYIGVTHSQTREITSIVAVISFTFNVPSSKYTNVYSLSKPACQHCFQLGL